ncbi:MAG: hypothetical protein ACK47B_24490 [Armatimonadota bacterium]
MEQSAGNQTSWSGNSGSGSMMEQAKETTRETMQSATQGVSELAHKAKDQIKTQASQQKDRAAESLHTVADAFRETGGKLQEQQPVLGNCMTAAGDVADNLSGYLREHDVEDMVREVENFARRQPTLLIGGALVLGFLAARFLKSSSSSASYSSGGGVPDDYTGQSRHPDWMVRGRPTRRELEGYRYRPESSGQGGYTGGGTAYGARTEGHTMPSGYQSYGSPTTGAADVDTYDETDDLTYTARGEGNREV